MKKKYATFPVNPAFIIKQGIEIIAMLTRAVNS